VSHASTDYVRHILPIFTSRVKAGAANREAVLRERLVERRSSEGKGWECEVSVKLGAGTRAAKIVPGEDRDVADAWLRQLSALNTRTLLLIMAGMKMAVDNGANVFMENIAAIGRERGQTNLADKERRRIREELNALTEIRFEMVISVGGSSPVHVEAPLILPAGTLGGTGGPSGRRVRLYSFHEFFFSAMSTKRRRFHYDPAILKAKANHDAVAVHMYFWACCQSAMGWAKNGLHANGGRLKRRLAVIAEQSGVDLPWGYKPSRVRQMVADALDKLKAPIWSGRALIQNWELERAGVNDPREDAYTLVLPVDLRRKLSDDNSQRIGRGQ